MNLKLVNNNIGATYSDQVLHCNKKNIDWYVINSRFEDYPISVTFQVSGEIFRAILEDFNIAMGLK